MCLKQTSHLANQRHEHFDKIIIVSFILRQANCRLLVLATNDGLRDVDGDFEPVGLAFLSLRINDFMFDVHVVLAVADAPLDQVHGVATDVAGITMKLVHDALTAEENVLAARRGSVEEESDGGRSCSCVGGCSFAFCERAFDLSNMLVLGKVLARRRKSCSGSRIQNFRGIVGAFHFALNSRRIVIAELGEELIICLVALEEGMRDDVDEGDAGLAAGRGAVVEGDDRAWRRVEHPGEKIVRVGNALDDAVGGLGWDLEGGRRAVVDFVRVVIH